MYSDGKRLVFLIGAFVFAFDGFDFISEILDFCGPGIAHSFHGGVVSEEVFDVDGGFLDIDFEGIDLFFKIEDGVSIDVCFDSE
jgi:hypothetical protein